ncbi:MAG TPA: right-handed parallel beta-helix repeat-containing protein, partial [Armatimonadota bacterium]|nr:right-handed parallel beta-helix repeat-containing protein [Armatimonadota bacterium]
PKPGLQLFVGPDGKATNRGTHNAPFATLTQARDAIRALDELPDGGVAVNVLPGAYEATSTFALEADDSGTEAQPITYRAHRKGTVRFSGGVAVTGFAPVTDAGILARMPEEAHGHVMQADLRAQGITEYGELMPRGTGRPAAPVLEVFFDDVPMKPARWPNDGFVKTGAIIDKGSKDPERDAIFTYDGERPSRWLQAKDAWLFGFWRHLWADDTLAVRGIDPDTHQIRAAPTSYGEVIGGMPYAAFNLLEEIDEPGEWYLDRMAGVLYLYPPSDPNAADVQVSMLDEPFVQTTDASWIAIEGLTFELGRGNGVEIAGGENCLVAGCTIRQIGGTGITVDGGTNHGALSCDIHTLGRYGTWVKGGDRQTLTPGGHFIENCHIYDFSRVCRTYTPAFWTDGVGNRFAHNRVHGSPGHGMRIEGNDHIIEYNEIFDVVRETDDQGGLDMWGNPTYRGVVLRYNYWHDIGNDRECGQCGIRLDDAICEVLIYGNVFYRCSTKLFGGVQIHGGKENYVENNLFADCRYAVSFSGWGPDRWHSVLNNPGVVKKGRDSVDIT